ncbi:endoplasmic reticulum membrane-associated RNA degradation protein-like [Anastrepha ludens]|uniref:endoplasmic reticulum membrane-associated RNA degradation protein-like n=1 Tax=Anastrepha ludens TaxID=28586 RepID=UPI0023B1E1B4|nr:endoplasmic reticulum membrane-associated RNA degradation protein-like [Anastrepha ludens]XP_053948150.1 endoplasmic reticulum membrane-associated RNA degradation protein-like [Anastrepha ludens]XP_053948151.1 endoplasmic reticulum membrane-associated RNA degradation protein-like [Anastrepha ludens]
MQQIGKCSLISEKISKYFVKFNTFAVEKTGKYVFSNWCLNFKELYGLFASHLESNDTTCRYDVYLACFHKLLPIFEGIHHLYCSEKLDLNHLQLEWLGSNCKYLLISLQVEETAATLSVERILLMTSLLENALANLYFTTSNKCTPPHLLRDLLRTEELYNIFGLEIISLLKIIMGTPDSINLRNIVWHGFPEPQEIPDYYNTILVLLIHSLGYELKKTKICLTERPKSIDFRKLCRKVSNQLILPSSWFNENSYVHQLKTHVWLNENYKIYWYQLLQYYKQQQYWKLVMLILPQIELLLRLIYAQVNNFDVTAKLSEYYITMDSIFETDVPCKKTNINNNLLNERVVSEELLKFVYDLFIAPNGPRLRDKISHGEVDITEIDNVELCDILLYLSLGLLSFELPFQKYESIFHLNCQAREALCGATKQLEQLVKKHLTEESAGILKGISEMKTPPRIKIFLRPKKESELVLLVLRNSNLVQATCVNYGHSIDTKLELLAQRELHSKRRRTLERMLSTLPMICTVLCDILNCLLHIFSKMQADDAIYKCEESLGKLLRFLKRTLKLNENMVKYSDKSNNEWIKAVQLCEKFHEVKMQHYSEQHL